MTLDKILPKIKKGVLLKNYTTYKIGGPARYFFIAKNKQDLIDVIKKARQQDLPIFILGGGSNLLVSEKGFKGVVIKIDISVLGLQGKQVSAGSGISMVRLTKFSAENNLSGLEWAAGLPGTLGGAIYGNAQAFGSKIADSIKSVEALNLKTLKFRTFSNGECRFALKNSIFKKNKNWIVVSAVLKVSKAGFGEIKNKMKEFLNYRKNNHPLNFPSAGSVFVNPELKITDKKLLEKFPALNEFNKRRIIPAGYLISQCGLSGKIKGKAQISKKHANFIINMGGAKSKDVLFLMNLAQREVKKAFGILLEPEVQIIA